MYDWIIQQFENPTLRKALITTIALAIIWIIIRILQKSLFSRMDDNEHRIKARKFSNFMGGLLTLLLFSIVFSEKLGNLTVALGVAGAGIAFALQEVIASFAGWLAILLGGFYKPGDRVQLGGIKGDVMDIGILRTTLMETGQWVDGDLYNGRIVLVANSFVFKEPVFNYSGDFPFLWDEIKIPIQYGSDYDLARQILLQIGVEVAGDLTQASQQKWQALQAKYRLEDAQTEPMVSLTANDNWVEYVLRYVVSYKKRRLTKTELFTRILREIDATKGKIKFASATFQLVEAPEIQVRIKNEIKQKKK
ncbi:MAG: mechanosensitive ion channel family protein [Turneriella sp.]|nr:mechanosensitive ion channel family protein [Turneriella sp.]